MASAVGTIQGKLIAVIERAEAHQAALMAQLSEVEKAAIGEPDHWAVKDQIAHLNFWRDVALRQMMAIRDGAVVPGSLDEDDDMQNARNFVKHQYTSWSVVIGESDRLFRAAKQVIGQLTDAQLTEPLQAAGGFSRADRFVSDFMEHPAEHLAQVYRERGDITQAEEQERATVQIISELAGQQWAAYGYALYNLGCTYARHGETAKAIAAIGEALPLVPRLVERSQKDPDLDALRAIPAFQALYTE